MPHRLASEAMGELIITAKGACMKKIVITVIVGVLMLFAFAAYTALHTASATKDTEVRNASVSIKVNQSGYSYADGSPLGESLKLPPGPVEIILLYAYPISASNDIESDNYPEHKFTILAPKDGERKEFRLESEALSPRHTKVVMKLNAGQDNVKKYTLYCEISCPAMGQLFKEIEVIG